MQLEHKFNRPEGGVVVSEGAVIAGYASLFGAADQGGDVVERGPMRRRCGGRGGGRAGQDAVAA